jgi:hypothetical protein
MLMVRGYDRVRTKQFEHTRVIVYTMAAANRDPNKPMPAMQEWWPLSTDEAEIQAREEDLNEMHARMLARLKKAHPKRFQAQT